MNTYYIKQTDTVQGPYTLDQITSMWQGGAITADATYRLGTEGTFQSITLLLTPPILEKNTAFSEFEKPNFLIRGGAFIIDFILMVVIASLAGGSLGVVGMLLEKYLPGANQFFLLLNWLVFVTVMVLLCALKDGFGGRSPSKRLFGLVAISTKKMRACGFVESFTRNFIIIVYVILFWGYCLLIGRPIAQLLVVACVALALIEIILMIVREDGRGLHDFAAETRVVSYKDFKATEKKVLS